MTRDYRDRRDNPTQKTNEGTNQLVIAPGKQTLTESLPASDTPPNAIAQRQPQTSSQPPQPRQTGLIEDWTDVSLRPDLYQSPLLRADGSEIGTPGPPYHGPIQTLSGALPVTSVPIGSRTSSMKIEPR